MRTTPFFDTAEIPTGNQEFPTSLPPSREESLVCSIPIPETHILLYINWDFNKNLKLQRIYSVFYQSICGVFSPDCQIPRGSDPEYSL